MRPLSLTSRAGLGLCGALLIGAPGAVAAQIVRGTVVLPDSSTPVGGAIIVASTSRGETAAQALSGEDGRFFLRLPRPGRYGLRALRIGFRITLADSVTVAEGETRNVRIVLSGVAVTLDAVTVRGKTVCRLARDDARVVAGLWDEARKAITSTQLSSPDGALMAHWITYVRATNVRESITLSERTVDHSGPTDHPFRSISVDSLARFGYVRDVPGGTAYDAPDADVLLSDSFAAGHCFHVEAPPGDHPEWVGIGFAPGTRRTGIIDIEGTLWLDRGSAELRQLEYHYLGLPHPISAVNPGGDVEFMRLPSGNWFVHR